MLLQHSCLSAYGLRNNENALPLVLVKYVSAGRKGLKCGCPAHLLNVAKILKSCWDSLKPSAVVSCWTRARFVPHTETVAISAEAETTVNMCELFLVVTMSVVAIDDENMQAEKQLSFNNNDALAQIRSIVTEYPFDCWQVR